MLITQESLETHKEMVKLTRQNDMNAKSAGPLDIYMYLNLYFRTCSPYELHLQQVLVWMKNFLGPPSKNRPAKKVYTKSKRLTVSCRVIWA
jgi:hypothetical protein